MQIKKLKNILEALLLAADRTLSVIQLDALFEMDEDRPTRDEIRKALHEMAEDYADRGYELKQVASGFRLQVRQEYADWIGRLWEEKPARYTRALLETIALVAYRQPITRGEIEEVRGVSVSSNIIKTLMEREWIKVLGHKDVPGKPALYGTTREFLDYFNLKSLDELPTLAEIKDLDDIHPELAINEDDAAAEEGAGVEGKGEAGADVSAEPETTGNNPRSNGAEENAHDMHDVDSVAPDAVAEVAASQDESASETVAEAEDATSAASSGQVDEEDATDGASHPDRQTATSL